MNKPLTAQQKKVLDYIKKYVAEHGFPPSTREIGAALGLSSSATVHVHLQKLINAGAIKKTGSKFRTIELLVDNEYANASEDIIKVPLLGNITCGNPIEAIEVPNEFFSLPASIIPGNKKIFTLKAEGDSMVNKGIYDGDIVIVEQKNTCNNGDIIVAMVNDNEVTLKTFYKEANQIRLQPENDTMEPMYFDNVTVLGKAIGLYRKI
ncbi:MAG: transcriptional repressor LexA [Bacilli bacterium]|nr:transcriptional repressor LexA [Bacilli bacterium]